jgi:hypothetical protein
VYSHWYSGEYGSDSADDTSFGHVRVHDLRSQSSQRAHERKQRPHLANYTQ